MLNSDLARELATQYGTPLWVMDAEVVRARVAQLQGFDTIRFAQKANPNTHVLGLLCGLGVKVDAVSRGEVLRAQHAGFSLGGAQGSMAEAVGAELVYTADLLDRETLDLVCERALVVNCGSLDMLQQLGERSPGHAVWLRINPGFGHGHSRKTNTGGEGSKHGIWHGQLPQALDLLRALGLRLVGLHMHIGSGVDYEHLARVTRAMLDAVTTVRQAGLDLHALSAGGGLSVPYRPEDPSVDTAHYFSLWDAARKQAEVILGHGLALEIEPGRFLVAEAGSLLAEVRVRKQQGDLSYLLIDAGFNDLVRPAMYGAHHAMRLITRTPRELGPTQEVIVAGPLCESGDVFTQDAAGELRPQTLPQADVGDWIEIERTGAYGSAMSSNYNTRPLAAEVLVDGADCRLIRRRQAVEDLLALESGL
ncbi:diaminopimelate decarboxylase [Inhella inkyongensis]|uniref:Diaminopimelate decarboxylase n=1 Tax=Inhella inkyongensis TaxID=392593 RepID=A0A840S1U2_9BURK|nr:diaminopimelate decarboxylase [Inhella inkyongensis]MBB5204265.1 diaminopimelate decarboxylase [Inhella inkyongensis]